MKTRQTNGIKRRLIGGSTVSALVILVTMVTIMASLFSALPTDDASNGTVGVTQELPRQWVWERDAITFDHMYPSRTDVY